MSAISSFHDEDGRRQLDAIDRLKILTREEHDIDLPQIVVVGQQSSGKSSVLRALSNIPFPTEDGLSTQFATEIVCRRSLKKSFRATILPAGNQLDPARQSRFDAFSASCTRVETEQDIADVLRDARGVLGLESGNTWSKDKLRLEFRGPTQDHLTLIDLPGLISVDGPKKTLVDELVASYLGGSQTIILAVVHGPLDLVNQRVFDLLDNYQERTVGVITAPDLVNWSTARGEAVRNLALNKVHKLGNKWHILRNLSSGELKKGLNRDILEKDFFDKLHHTISWMNTGDILLGIDLLRKTLGNLLKNRIQAHLPRIQERLDEKLKEFKAELDLFGEERYTSEQRRKFLKTCTRKLRARIEDGIQGRPRLDELEHDISSLRDSVRSANEELAVYMEKNGHTWKEANKTDPKQSLSKPTDAVENHRDEPYKVSLTDIQQYIGEQIYHKPGRSLRGIPDPIWIGVFFRKQSRKWQGIVSKHGDTVCDIVGKYLLKFAHECADSETAKRFLEFVLIPDLQQRRKALHEKLTELLTPYSSLYPTTLSRGYLGRISEMETAYATGAVGHESIAQKNGCFVLRCMWEYYLVARDVLLDNVESLAIENVLLKGLEEVLTTDTVSEMSDQQLADIAGESPAIADKRTALKSRVQDLEEARTLLSTCMFQRPPLGPVQPKSQANSLFSTNTTTQSTRPVQSTDAHTTAKSYSSEAKLAFFATTAETRVRARTEPRRATTSVKPQVVLVEEDSDSGVDTSTPLRLGSKPSASSTPTKNARKGTDSGDLVVK